MGRVSAASVALWIGLAFAALPAHGQDATRCRAKAAAAFKAGNYADAAFAYQCVLRETPDDAQALAGEGISLQRIGYHTRAIERLDAALAKDAGNADARLARGLSHLAQHEFPQAQADFQQLIDAAPRDAEPRTTAQLYNWLGLARSLAGDDTSALEAFSAAVKLRPRDPVYRLNRAASYHFSKRYKDAIADLDVAIGADPKDPYAFSNRALAKVRLGDLQGGRADFSKAVALAKSEGAPRGGEGLSAPGTVAVNEALLHWAGHQNKPALQALQQARELAPDALTVAFLTGLVRFESGEFAAAAAAIAADTPATTPAGLAAQELRAKALLNAGDPANAAEALETILAAKPEHPDAQRLLGDARFNLGQLATAADAYATQLQRFPDDLRARRHRADALYYLGDFEAAAAELSRLLEKQPNDAAALARRGDAYYRKARYEPAAADYEAALARGEAPVPLLLRLGQAQEKLGKPDAAIAAYGKALERQPDNVALRLRRGNLRFQGGDAAGALTDYEAVVRIAPKRADVHVYLAETQVRLKQPEQAIASYGRALELNPSLSGAYLNRGILLQRLGRAGEACTDWQRACTLGEGQGCAFAKKDCK